MGGGGSSGPKYLDPEIIQVSGTSTTGGISSKKLVQTPIETFNGCKIIIFKKNKNNSLLIYIFVFILLLFGLYFFSRIKK